MTDLPTRLADRIEKLDNPLAIVLSIHVFVEFLLNQLLEQRSPDVEAAKLIVKDVGRYGTSERLVIAQAMKLIDRGLRRNLEKLSTLRNAYAHQMDVDLPERLFGVPTKDGFLDRNGKPAFAEAGLTKSQLQDDPRATIQALLVVRDVTFGWLHDVCVKAGVSLT